MTDVLGKFVDAASMFWQSLDDEQRRLVTFAGFYVIATVVVGMHTLANERREARIRRQVLAELRGDGAAAA